MGESNAGGSNKADQMWRVEHMQVEHGGWSTGGSNVHGWSMGKLLQL